VDTNGFSAYLKERGGSDGFVNAAIGIAEEFETFVAEGEHTIETDAAATQAVHAFSKAMIERDINTWDNYIALYRYGGFLRNDAVLIAAIELIDGAEALERLHAQLAEAHGEELRDRMFDGVALPALGAPNTDKPVAMARVIRRLEGELGGDGCIDLLKDSLRYLEDAWYADGKTKFDEAGGIDAFLEVKGRDFVAQLEKHRDEGTLFFSQPINDAVIDYVNAHPEIRSGVRDGSRVIEAKIPHQAIKFLQATDPAEKAYHYCHCPWAKESLRDGPSDVPPIFCNCSAGFHKKPYEVIFGQPLRAEVLECVLAGDPWCKFAIYLPEEVGG